MHAGPEQAALETATARLDDDGPWDPRSLSDLRSTAPSRLSGAEVQACDGDRGPVPDDLGDDARSALLYGDVDEATSLLEAGRSVVLCGDGALPTTAVARLEFLSGVAAAIAGDTEGAVARFRAALALDPEQTWDDTWPAEHAPLLDEARELESDTVTLEVHPSGATLDGQPWEKASSASEVAHWLVVGDHTLRLTPAFNDTLVVPGAFPDDALAWADDDARRLDLSRLLAATLGEGTDVVVVHDGTAWEGVAGRVDWTAHRPPAPAPLPEPVPVATETTTRRSAAPTVLTAVGAGLAAIGGGLLAESYLTMGSAVDKAGDATSGKAYDDQWERYAGGQTRAKIGYGVLGAGVVTAGIGIVIRPGGSR